MAESLTKWRERHQRDFDSMERLERIGQEFGLPEGCVVYSWGILWSVQGGGEHDLADFAERVRQITEILGPPESCSGEISVDKVASLSAVWRDSDRNLTLYVQTAAATGCKVDPRSPAKPTVWGESGKLHPECQAVLAELGA